MGQRPRNNSIYYRTNLYYDRVRLSYHHTTCTFRKYTPLEESGLKIRPYVIRVTCMEGGRESIGGEIEWVTSKNAQNIPDYQKS